MRFTKMQGLGNDYVYLNCTGGLPDNLPELAVRLSDRHFGVGADGLICICPSEWADFGMRIFNADGSEGAMCGNGIRCLGKYVYDKGLTRKTSLLTVETASGVRYLELFLRDGLVQSVLVDMGRPELSPPVKLMAAGRTWQAVPVSVGNPHAVVFCDGVDALNLAELGPALERHPAFPDRVNVEFVQSDDRGGLKVRVWERGSGETLACGTGACAALTAAARAGLVSRHTTVHLPGGELEVRWAEENGHLYMTGPAVTVFEGEISLENENYRCVGEKNAVQ